MTKKNVYLTKKAKKTSVKNGIAPLAIPGASEATKMKNCKTTKELLMSAHEIVK